MSNEQKQKLKDYRKEYHKKYYAEKKLNNKKSFVRLVIIKGYQFDKHKNNIVVLLTLNKSKKIVIFTYFKQVTYISLQNSLRRNWMPEQPLLFTY